MFNRYTTETLRATLAETTDEMIAEMIRQELATRTARWLMTHKLPQSSTATWRELQERSFRGAPA